MPDILSMNIKVGKLIFCLLIIPPCFTGEWQTRFDPQVTSKGVFYLDNQNSVPVDMMKSAQYPLRLLDDPELEAQVTLLLEWVNQ